MAKTFLSALATVTVVSCGLFTAPAVAMPAAAQAFLPVRAGLIHKAAVLCGGGGGGCVPVHTKQAQRKKFYPLGYTKPI
jgi:hypothetical protein